MIKLKQQETINNKEQNYMINLMHSLKQVRD